MAKRRVKSKRRRTWSSTLQATYGSRTTGNDRIEEISTTGAYLRVLGKKGKKTGELMEPKGLSVDATGDVWVADRATAAYRGGRSPTRSGGEATDAQTIYYTAGTNYYTACGEHAEWAGLPYQTQPTAQPDDSLPKLVPDQHLHLQPVGWDENRHEHDWV